MEGGSGVPLIGQGSYKSPSPLQRSNLLGFIAMLDAVSTVSLVIFSIEGNIWTSLFPTPWFSQEALATGLGDILILLVLRWTVTTSAGTGAAFMLSPRGVTVMSCVHLLATLYLASKIMCAVELLKLNIGWSVHTHIAVAISSILAMWLEFFLTLRSLSLLRYQLRADQLSSGMRPGTEMWHTASEARQPLLPRRETTTEYPEEVTLRDMPSDPAALGAAIAAGGVEVDIFEDARSEVSFQSTTSAQTAASFASAASHLTSASYASARTHRTASSGATPSRWRGG